MSRQIRVATYNVHKCRGLDGRTRPERIAHVISQLDADIVALQEILEVQNGRPEIQILDPACHPRPRIHMGVEGERERHTGERQGA